MITTGNQGGGTGETLAIAGTGCIALIFLAMMGLQVGAADLTGYGIIAGTLTVIGIRKKVKRGGGKNWFRWAGIAAVLGTTSALARFAGAEEQELNVVSMITVTAVLLVSMITVTAVLLVLFITTVIAAGAATLYKQRRKPEQYANNNEAPNPTPVPPTASSTAPRTNGEDPEGTILSVGAGTKRMAPRPVMSEANVELTKKLGSGGFGITWQAYDYVTRKEVAIKIYRPADWAEEGPDGRVSLRSEGYREEYEWGLKRFLEEGQLLRTVSHQAVVRVHRYGHGYGSAYLVMELIAGQSLREHLKRTQPARDIQAVRRLMLNLCAGLDAIHRAGIIHRDMKPGNVMLRASGQPVLIDFGSARQRSQDRTRSMTAIVTPGYAPLEQYDRNGRQGPWTDLYALAAIGHEMLLGHHPGDAPGRVANPDLKRLDDLERRTGPSRTINAIRRGLAVQASERPQTCNEIIRLLTEKPGNYELREEQSSDPIPTRRASARTTEQSIERGFEMLGITGPERAEMRDAFPDPEELLLELRSRYKARIRAARIG